jgi:hypothetical protein
MPVVRLGGSALDVQLVRELTGSVLIEEHGNADVASGVETTLASTTVDADKYVRIKAQWGEGDADGLWKLYIDGSVVWEGRNNWCSRNVQGLMEYQADEGVLIALKVTNLHTATSNFSGGFYGYRLENIAGA